MTRTIAIATTLITLALPLTLEAQEPKPARIGILRISEPPPQYLEQFRAGMRERGHEEGRTYQLVPAWTKSRKDRKGLLANAKKLVAEGVDVLVTEGTRVGLAARRATPSIPIVMTSGNPIGAKLVKSLAKPGGNVTGLHSGTVYIASKSFQILKELVPGLKHGASLHRLRRGATTLSSTAKIFFGGAEHAGHTLGFKVSVLFLKKGEDYRNLLARAQASGVGAIYVRATPFLSYEQKKALVAAALAAKIPTMYSTAHMVTLGGLVSYGTHRPTLYRRAAAYVDRILKGAKPKDLPIERPNKFDLTINLKTAKKLGIAIPPSILLRADKVIE